MFMDHSLRYYSLGGDCSPQLCFLREKTVPRTRYFILHNAKSNLKVSASDLNLLSTNQE